MSQIMNSLSTEIFADLNVNEDEADSGIISGSNLRRFQVQDLFGRTLNRTNCC